MAFDGIVIANLVKEFSDALTGHVNSLPACQPSPPTTP